MRVNDQYRIVFRFEARPRSMFGAPTDTALLLEALTGWDDQIWLTLQVT